MRSCVFPLLIRAYSNINSGKAHHRVCVCAYVCVCVCVSRWLTPAPTSLSLLSFIIMLCILNVSPSLHLLHPLLCVCIFRKYRRLFLLQRLRVSTVSHLFCFCDIVDFQVCWLFYVVVTLFFKSIFWTF